MLIARPVISLQSRLSQLGIPTDVVDEEYLQKPRKWNIDSIKKFMLFVGPTSSVFDYTTYFLMLFVFGCIAFKRLPIGDPMKTHYEQLFHTGWFVESLATQTLVLFVIRTFGNPFKSKPSAPLAITTVLITVVGIVLPFSRAAGTLGFLPLPGAYFVFLGISTLTYLLLVEFAKRRLFSHARA